MRAKIGLAVLFGALVATPATYGQQASTSTLVPQPMPRDVMYRILFREIAAYQAQASQLASQLKPNAFVANYHQKVLELTPLQAAQLINVALPCARQIQLIDQQAAAIIDGVKKQYKNMPRGAASSLVPPPPPQLSALEAQRTSVILAAADLIAAAFGPAQFAYFESLVRLHVGSNFKAVPAKGSQ